MSRDSDEGDVVINDGNQVPEEGDGNSGIVKELHNQVQELNRWRDNEMVNRASGSSNRTRSYIYAT